MKVYPSDASYTQIVLKKGEELTSVLTEYARVHALDGGWINVIGGAAMVT